MARRLTIMDSLNPIEKPGLNILVVSPDTKADWMKAGDQNGRTIAVRINKGITATKTFSFRLFALRIRNGIKSIGYNLNPAANPIRADAWSNLSFLRIKNAINVKRTG